MRERDLERATQLFAQIKSIESDYATHDAFGKHLGVRLALPNYGTANNSAGESEQVIIGYHDADLAQALDLNYDELHMRTNLLIRQMLDEKMTNVKAELRKLGVKLEDEQPTAPKTKAPKQKLLPSPTGGGK